jgi:hypothetical protein
VSRLLVWTAFAAGCSEYDVHGGNDLNGSGAPDIAVQPELLDFGSTGTAEYVTRSVRISNLGTAPLEVTGLVVDADAGVFSVPDPDATSTIAPGDSITREVVWTPTDEVDDGVLHIASNDGDTPDLAVPLTGRSLYAELTITPDPLVFDLLPVGCAFTAPVTLANTGFGPLTVTDVSVAGTGYTLTSAPGWPLDIPPNAFTKVDVTFTPQVGGVDLDGDLAAASTDRRGLVTSRIVGSASAPVPHLDTFEQSDGATVDLMFFIDSSGSMNDDALNLAANFHLFLDELVAAGIDYQVMVSTEDDGCHNEEIITPLTPDPELVFGLAVNGGGGNFYEAGLTVTANALLHTGVGQCNEGFVRPSVPVLTVQISDEKDQSPLTWDVLVADMQSIAPDVIVNGVVGQSNIGCASNGSGYHEAIAATGGVDLDLCDTDWGQNVLDILGTVTLLDSFSLQAVPVPDTIVVLVNGVTATGWSWDPTSNDIEFDASSVPPEEAVIEVSYEEAPVCP